MDFLAWNLASVSFVAGQGFLAGWIAEAAAWDACLTAARLLQQTLSGWDQLGTEYLRGCEHWFGEPDQALHYIHRALILERGGPWSLPWSTPLA